MTTYRLTAMDAERRVLYEQDVCRARDAVYCLTPTTEEAARAVALRNQPQPVHYYELPQPQRPAVVDVDDDDPDF